MIQHLRRCLLLGFFLALTLLSSACTPPLSPQTIVTQAPPPETFPQAYYREAQAAGSSIYQVDPNRSIVTIIVRRDGALARLGHDHVVASHHLNGFVDVTGERADLHILLEQLVVDETALRLSAGFTSQPSEDAIAGTRQNMLNKVLDAKQFPHVLISVKRKSGESQVLSTSITLHGIEKNFEIPVQFTTLADGLEVNGQLAFNQSDFGITPFSILGGAIRVNDRLDLAFKIVARK